MKVTNEGHIITSGSFLNFEENVKNFGNIQMSQNTEVKIRSLFSDGDSSIFGEGVLRVTGGTSKISPSVLDVSRIKIEDGTVDFKFRDGSGSVPKTLDVVSGSVGIDAEEGVALILDTVKIDNGNLNLRVAMEIANLTMTGGNFEIRDDVNVDRLDFTGGTIQSPSSKTFTILVQQLYFHHHIDTVKKIQHLTMKVGQKASWKEIPLIEDSFCMENSGKLVILEGATFIVDGLRNAYKCSNSGVGVITNYGTVEVIETSSKAPRSITHLKTSADFRNFGSVIVDRNCKVSFLATATLDGTFSSGVNSTVEFNNHHSSSDLNLNCTWLEVKRSKVVLAQPLSIESVTLGNTEAYLILTNRNNLNEVTYNISYVKIIGGTLDLRANIHISHLDMHGGSVTGHTVQYSQIHASVTKADIRDSSSFSHIDQITFEDVNFYGRVVSFGSSNAVFTKKSSLLTFLIFSLSGGANITNQADSLMQVNGETVYEKCSGVDRCSLFNYGRIDVYGPSLSVLADFYNYGTVVATGGKVSVDVVTPDAVQINGVYEMRGVNQKLTFNEPYEEVSTASYTGQAQLDENSHFEDGSTLTVTGGTLKMTPLSSAYDSIVNGLNVIVEGGTVLFNESSSTTGTRLKINSLVITSGEVVLDGNLADISSIDMNGGSLLGSGTVLKFVWKSGNFKDADIDIIDLELHSGSDKAIINSALNVRRHLTNSYTNTLTLSRDSSLTNGINSRFSIIAPLTINSGEDDGSILLNKGNISISTVLGQEVIFDVQFNSTGGIELSGGVLKLVKDSLMSASIDMKSGTRLQFDDGEHELSASSSVTGNGKIRVQDSALLTSSTNNVVIDKFESSGNAFLKGSSCIGILLVLDGSVELNGGLEANEGISIGFLQVYGGTLQCPGLAAINGPATLTSGQVFVTGTLYANGDLHIGDDVTTLGNIEQPPDASCSSITDCSSCIAPCQWNPITNLCIAQSRSGPQCHQADCSVPSLCYGYDSNARCVATSGCTWCQWAERCVPADLCVKSGDSVFWANTNGGDWSSAGSWFNSSTPSDDSDVFIGQHDADYTVQVTSDTNVKSITIGVPCEDRRIPMCDHIQELSVQSTLRVSDRILVHKTGHLTLKGTLSIDGTITIYGKMTWRWGTLTGDGNVTVFGTLDIFNDWYHYYRYTHNVLQTKIANRGVLHYRNTRNQLVFNEGGVITNEHTGLIYLSSTWTVDSGVLYNHGTIIASIGGELQFGPQIFNHGTFELKVGKVKFVSGMFCSGILNLADGTEFLLMNVVYDIASTCRIEAQGAKLATSGATVNFDPEFYAVESLSLTANSIFVANQTVHVSYMYWDRVTFSGSGDIIVDDLLEWKGATIEGKKDITVNGEMRLLYPERYSYRRTKVIKRGHLVLKGRNFITADDIVLQLSENATVDFDSMASVYVSQSKPFTIQSDSSMCRVTNYGSIIVDGTMSLSTDFQNHGNLSIERGRMIFYKNSYFGSGQVTSFATGTVEFHGSNHMFLVDSSLFLDGHVSMQAQSLVINSSICHHIGSISSSSGNIEISDQSDIRTIGSINLYRANVFLQSLHGGQVDIKYAELRRDGRLYLRTSAKLNTVTFSEYSYTGYLYLGSSVNSYEIYNAVNWVHGYGQFVGETTSDKPTLRITGSFQRHGRQSTYIRSVNLEIHGNLYHTDDGDLIFSDDTNVYMEEDSCASLRGSYWSVSGSGTKNITNYGSINVLQGSTLNVPFTNYGTVNVNARTSLYVWSSSLFATNKVTILPKGSINFAKGATHAVAADCVFEIHEEGLIRVHDRDTKFNITQANYIKGLEILGTSAIVHANATTGKLSIGYLRLDYTNSFNFYGRELYINRLHWEEGYLNLNGGTMDVGQLIVFWGTRSAKASLNNGVARLKSQHDLHEYIGRSGQSRQYVIVNGHLILESGETTAFFAKPLYIEGTGKISSYRNIYVPSGNTIEVYPEFRCHANCTVGGILNLRSGGEIDNSVLHFIDDGHINILGSNFNLSDVTLLGKGTIYASSGKLTIRGQSSSKSGVSTDIHVYVSQGECMVSYTDDPTFIDSVTMTDSGSMTLTGTQIEIMSVSFIPDYSHNTKLIVDATQSATVTDILLRSYRGGASMDVSGAFIVKRKMTWNSGHINGELEISPDAELFFQTNNFKQIQNGVLNIHGTAYSYDDMYLTLIDSAVNVTGTWYFVNGFEFRSNCQNDCLFVNYGVLEVAAPDGRLTIESGITLNNHGKLNIIHGTVIIKKIESLGEVHAGQDSSLTIHDMRSTLNNSSSLHFENSTLTVSGDSHVDVDGLLANIQHLYMDGGTLSIVNADEFQVATITIDGGTLVVNTDFYVNTLVMRGGLVTGNGILRTDNMVLYDGNIEIGYPDSYPGIRELEDWRSQERQTRDVDDYSDYNSFDYDSYAGDPPGASYLVVSEDLLLASSTSHIYGMFVTSGVVRQTSNNRIYLERNGVFLSENRVEIFSSLTIGGDSGGLFINNGTIVVDSGETSEGLSVNVPFINFGDIEVLSGKFYTTPTRYEVSRYYGSLDVSSLGLLTFSFGEHYFLKNSSISVQGSMELPHSSYNTLVRVERDAQSVYIKKLTMWQDRSSVELSASESRIEETYLSGGLLLLHGDVKVDACQLSSDGNLRIRKTTEIGKLTFLNGYLYGMGQRPKIFVDDFGWFDGRIYTTEDNFFNVDVRKNAWFVHDDTKEMDYNAILTIKEKASFASRGSTRLRRFSQIIIDENARVYQYEGNIIADGNDAQVINRGTHNTGDFRKNAHLLLNVMLQSPGQINVQEGNLRLGKGGSLSTVSTGALSSVQIIEGSFTVAPESLKGKGTLKPTGGVLAFSSGLLSVPLILQRGTIAQINADAVVTATKTVTIQGGTLRVNGLLNITKNLEFMGGTIEGDGILKIRENTTIHIKDSTENRDMTVAFVRNFGTMTVTSQLRLNAGEFRNEESGRVTIKDSGSITGNGILTNAGLVEATHIHSERVAQITTGLENVWVIHANDCPLQFTQSSPRQHFTVHSRVIGERVLFRGTVRANGVYESTADINGNLAVTHALVLDANITWSGGNIYGEDSCQNRYYNPASSSLMIPPCPDQYILNKGHLQIIDTSSGRNLGEHLEFVNQGKLSWLGGEIHFHGAVINAPSGEILIQGPSQYAPKSYRYTSFPVENHGSMTVNMTRADLSSSQFANFKAVQLLDGAHLALGSFSQQSADSVVSIAEGASMEIPTLTITTGKIICGGNIQGHLHIENAVLNIQTCSISRNLVLGEKSVMEVDIFSTSEYDNLIVDEDVTVNGGLKVSWNNGVFRPRPGTSFK
ncbi:uncharacterized protein [Ptychodera flava]|uniref:uncharacterized protein n=1 Tax=Ptychodera flava TaxID=63121 RepID=UPI00396A491D